MPDINSELASLPQLDSIEATVAQVQPVRVKYLEQARAVNDREQAGDPLVIARLQAVQNAADRHIQLATARLWTRGTLCTLNLSLLTPEERAGL
jgi:hypothetical protein